MIPKIVLWGTMFYGTFLLNGDMIISQYRGILYIIIQILIFCAYIVLLYWEIRGRIKKAATQKQLRWVGFYFTFAVGFLWALSFQLFGKKTWFSDPIIFWGLLASDIVVGIMIGIVGMAITQFMILFFFKQPE